VPTSGLLRSTILAQKVNPSPDAVVVLSPRLAALAGLLLQVLDTGTRRRRGGVFDVIVRGTARVGGAVR
jgi:hypothetical protein